MRPPDLRTSINERNARGQLSGGSDNKTITIKPALPGPTFHRMGGLERDHSCRCNHIRSRAVLLLHFPFVSFLSFFLYVSFFFICSPELISGSLATEDASLNKRSGSTPRGANNDKMA